MDEVRPEAEDKGKSPLGQTQVEDAVKADAEPAAAPEPAASEAEEKAEKPQEKDSVEKKKEDTAVKEEVKDDGSTSRLQETISLLIAERSDLQEQLAKLKASLSAAEADSKLLAEGRDLITKLEGEKTDLESRLAKADEKSRLADELGAKVGSLEGDVKGLTEERDRLKDEAEEVEERRRKEGEGEKERTDELEKSLSRAREREGGLEAEIGRLRSVSRLTASWNGVES